MRVTGFLMAGMFLFFLLGGTGCSKRQVTRTDPDVVTDFSGRWNDTDSRLVSEQMIGSCLSRAWVVDFAAMEGRKPVVIVGSIANLTDEHIDTRVFLKDIEREMLNSGRIDLVADPSERGQIRDERLDQLENASPETVKRLGMELGADFMLTGEIHSTVDQVDGKRAVAYQVDLQLVSIETNQKVWIEQKKIKKVIQRGRYQP